MGLPAAGKTTLFNALTRAGVGPDFGKEQLKLAITEFRARDRRFGGLTQRSSA